MLANGTKRVWVDNVLIGKTSACTYTHMKVFQMTKEVKILVWHWMGDRGKKKGKSYQIHLGSSCC